MQKQSRKRTRAYPAQLDDTDGRIEALAGVVRLQGALIAELVQSNAELREAAGLDPPLPTISASTDWRSIKQVAHVTGYSETQVRELIGQKKNRRGKAWRALVHRYVRADAEQMRESAIARSGRAPRTAVDG
jgi:hypothetical protein